MEAHSPRFCVRPLWLVPIFLAQAACVSVTRQYPEPPPIHRAPITPPKTHIPPTIPAPPTTPASEPKTGAVPRNTAPPAVLALMNAAQASLASGELDNAAASLERAIRLQPRNPQLWHTLAEVRLKQQQPGLAEDLAKKSNLHAQGRTALMRANWAIIAEARRQKGDTEGAAEAQHKAGE